MQTQGLIAERTVRTTDWTHRQMNSTPLLDAIKRYRVLALIGVVVALLLGALTFIRSKPVYQSNSVIFVTQKGFPAGRTLLSGDNNTTQFADPSSLVSLAALYSRLADSDVVRNKVLSAGPLRGEVTTELLNADTNDFNSGTLPLVQISGLSSTKADAVSLATRWTEAFTSYIEQQQDTAEVPANQRVVLEQVTAPTIREVKTVKPRSLTRPVAIIVAVLILFLGVILALDSQRQRRPATQGEGPDGDAGTGTGATGGGAPDADDRGSSARDAGAATAASVGGAGDGSSSGDGEAVPDGAATPSSVAVVEDDVAVTEDDVTVDSAEPDDSIRDADEGDEETASDDQDADSGSGSNGSAGSSWFDRNGDSSSEPVVHVDSDLGSDDAKSDSDSGSGEESGTSSEPQNWIGAWDTDHETSRPVDDVWRTGGGDVGTTFGTWSDGSHRGYDADHRSI